MFVLVRFLGALGPAPWRGLPLGLPPLALLLAVLAPLAAPAAAGPETLPALKPWTGDLDAMVQRRAVRFLVPYSPTFYFLDGATQRGITYEYAREFEKQLNTRLKTKSLRVEVVIIPTPPDRLLSGVAEGYGDIAAGNLTITEERLKRVDFSDPFFSDVSEVVVTAGSAAPIAREEDLAGLEIHVRESSSYYESLLALNERLAAAGKAPVRIRKANELLTVEDLLEMVQAEMIPATLVDRHQADFWAGVLDNLQIHEAVPLRQGGRIAWAFRQDSPQLAAAVNGFVKGAKKGTQLGNIFIKRYYGTTKWLGKALSEDGVERFHETAPVFQRYAGEYGFDWLLLIAQGYQESGLDQNAKSKAGAVGIMQVLPSTAADPNVGVADIDKMENNVHAGAKYMRFMLDTYMKPEELDALNRGLFALASYNAGPNRIARLREKAAEQGYDPNRWFHNVEHVVAKEVGREPVRYVSNIFKYYLAYQGSLQSLQTRRDILNGGAGDAAGN
ncbi:transporter substrate-binding domain-containing protein [Pelagibius sp. CAU 1746]|uniref:transglycosylase SLT domain-containing protein n=1 Tax=Pelagibius sp. CAU 1746 TaxID=3140370 RepID=UPI00325B7757